MEKNHDKLGAVVVLAHGCGDPLKSRFTGGGGHDASRQRRSTIHSGRRADPGSGAGECNATPASQTHGSAGEKQLNAKEGEAEECRAQRQRGRR